MSVSADRLPKAQRNTPKRILRLMVEMGPTMERPCRPTDEQPIPVPRVFRPFQTLFTGSLERPKPPMTGGGKTKSVAFSAPW